MNLKVGMRVRLVEDKHWSAAGKVRGWKPGKASSSYELCKVEKGTLGTVSHRAYRYDAADRPVKMWAIEFDGIECPEDHFCGLPGLNLEMGEVPDYVEVVEDARNSV